jgi:putative endonuclease
MSSFVYILTNQHHTTIYIGVTRNIEKRIAAHKAGIGSQFTKKYKLHKLVYYEQFHSMDVAIMREKQLKAGSRKKKLTLIETNNPNWKELYSCSELILLPHCEERSDEAN